MAQFRGRTMVAFAALGLAAAVAAPAARAQAPTTTETARRDFTQADVAFMQGMIGHHAQAIVMSAMAPSHGASPQLRVLADKIGRSQHDEIELMQNWLRDRGQAVPDPADPRSMHMAMHGMHAMKDMDKKDMDKKDMGMKDMDMKDMDMKDMDMPQHEMLMPGMLTAAQLAELDHARGTEFDRLYLTFMIRHHEGALTMVRTLFDTAGSGQGAEIFGYATGVDGDQRAEIGRMQLMLASITR
jgi:uncharacterized protein (DUF305 family)